MPVVNRGQDRLHTPPTLFPDFLRQSLSGHPSCEPASQWLKAFMRQGPNCLPLALKSLPQMQVKCENQLCKILGKAPLCTGRQTREVNPRGFLQRMHGSRGGICLALLDSNSLHYFSAGSTLSSPFIRMWPAEEHSHRTFI